METGAEPVCARSLDVIGRDEINVLARALDRDPGKRFRCAAELVQALQ